MIIGSITHKGLQRLIDSNDTSKLDARAADKIRLIVAFLEAMEDVGELKGPPKWNAHVLTGDRVGTWSLLVTRNWRLTFRIDGNNIIQNLNYEDYH